MDDETKALRQQIIHLKGDRRRDYIIVILATLVATAAMTLVAWTSEKQVDALIACYDHASQ